MPSGERSDSIAAARPTSQGAENPPSEASRLLFPGGRDRLILGDALEVARSLPPSSLDLIYLDPPFGSGRTHSAPEPAHRKRGMASGGSALGARGACGAGRDSVVGEGDDVAPAHEFDDRWDDGLDGYLAWLFPLLEACRTLLKPTGSLYLHLDWRACHYAKVELDRLFGRACFLNHIVWLYGLGGSSRRYWPRKHDDILWYARNPGAHYFEPVMVPATSQRMRGLDKKAPDYWDIPALNNMATERVGYPTQKPEALLERIIASSCPPGGSVADFCAGSGTTPAVARRLGRRWIASDISERAIAVIEARLAARLGPPFDVEALDAPREAGMSASERVMPAAST